MHFSTLSLAIFPLLQYASAAAQAPHFHVTNFHTNSTTTTLNVVYKTFFTASCTIPASAETYVFCGAEPEQAYYAYTKKTQGKKVLEVKFESDLPGPNGSDIFEGSKVLKKKQAKMFNVPAKQVDSGDE